MPSSSKQGIGQYRYDSQYKYLDSELDLTPEYYSYGDSISYRDVYFKLEGDNIIKSSNTYFLHLELPQHIQYTTVVKIKLCAANIRGEIDRDAFQEIRELTIPPIANAEKLFESVIIYIDPDESRINPEGSNLHADIYYIDSEERQAKEDYQKDYVYYNAANNEYFRWDGNGKQIIDLDQKSIADIQKTWMAASLTKATTAFDIVFSPKYNLSNGYPYLLLEIDRTGSYQSQIQYKDDNENTYNGTYLDTKEIVAKLSVITNLLENTNDISSTPIKTGKSPNVLNHIAVWGHPELMLAINGEEIKIGQTNFYELNDFTIKSLGVVAKDVNDRFTIDYQYVLN